MTQSEGYVIILGIGHRRFGITLIGHLIPRALAGAIPSSQKLYRAGNDFGGVSGDAILFPGTGLQLALHINLAALGKVLSAEFAQ